MTILGAHAGRTRNELSVDEQVLAAITEWDRLSFTAFEAQRRLSKLGFACRRVGEGANLTGDGKDLSAEARTVGQRLDSLESEVAIIKHALPGVDGRITQLGSQL